MCWDPLAEKFRIRDVVENPLPRKEPTTPELYGKTINEATRQTTLRGAESRQQHTHRLPRRPEALGPGGTAPSDGVMRSGLRASTGNVHLLPSPVYPEDSMIGIPKIASCRVEIIGGNFEVGSDQI